MENSISSSISFDSPPASSSISFDAPPVFLSVRLDCSSFSSSQGVYADTQIISDSAEIYTTEIVTLCLKHKKQHYTILDKNQGQNAGQFLVCQLKYWAKINMK